MLGILFLVGYLVRVVKGNGFIEKRVPGILLAQHPSGFPSFGDSQPFGFERLFRERPIVIHATFEKKIMKGDGKNKVLQGADEGRNWKCTAFYIFLVLVLTTAAGVGGFLVGKRAESRNYIPVPSDN